MANPWGNSDKLYLGEGGLQNHCRRWVQPWNWKTLAPWKKSYDQPRQHIKKQRQSYGYCNNHVWMWELDYKESWAQNWCFWTVVLEKTLESPLDCKEIQIVHPKGDQSWVFTGRTDVEAETPILWPPDAKSWLIGKDSDPGKDWGQEEKKSWVFFPEPWFPEPWFPEPMLYKPDVEFIKYYMWKYWKNTDDT